MKNFTTLIIALALPLSLCAQNIEFSFANSENTNDGVNDFYEVDVMIATVDGLADFKLGKGQVYINYNAAAFGSFIESSGGLEITYPESEGYILGLTSGFPYYTTPVQNDNSESRFSFSYQQGISSGTMPSNNVTATPTKLFHIKMQYTDAGQQPMVAFEDNEVQPPGVAGCRDQFETACGPTGSGFPDCVSFPGVVFNDALFVSSPILSVAQNDETELKIYPNPVSEILQIKTKNPYTFILTDVLGKQVKTGQLNTGDNDIDLSLYESGAYFLRLIDNKGSIVRKIIID